MTTSYTTGTVSVTAGSDIVTGSGTGWLSANVAPGFLGLDSDNGNPVPVAELVSDTSLRLVKPWRGASASGQSFWLSYDTRDGQQTVNNSQRLAEYIARLNNTFFSAIGSLTPVANTFLTFNAAGTAVLSSLTAAGRALLGVTGAANVLPYFTGAASVSTTALTSVGRSIIGAEDQSSAYAALGEIPNARLPTRLQTIPTAVTTEGALDTIGETGWVSVTAANVPTVNGPSGANNGVCFTIRLDGAAAVQTYYNVSGNDNAWTRRRTGGAWTAWSQEAFVPTRLGTTGLVLSDANLAVDTGLYIVDLSGANIPPRAARTMILHQRFSPTIMTQVAVTWTNPTQLWTRYLSGTTWSAWVLVGTTVVGSVSQSAGVPTGAIIERGSNANGEYVKLADGTQICTMQIPIVGITVPAGSTYSVPTASYPAAFLSIPTFSTLYRGAWSDRVISTGTGTSTSVGAIGTTFLRNFDTVDRLLPNAFVMVIAIGRWF